MRKRLSLLAIGALSVLGLFAAPSANAATGCASLYVNVNGDEVVNQQFCTPA